MEKILEKLNKLVLFFMIYAIVFITFFGTLSYTLPFVIAVIFALILKAPTRLLISKLKLKESIASLITTAIFFAIITILLFLLIAALASEVSQMTRNLSGYATSKSDDISYLFDKLQNYFYNLDPYIIEKIQDSMSSSITNITKTTANVGMVIVSALVKFLSSIPYLIMVIIFTLISTYFFTKDLSKSNNKFISTLFSHNSSKINYIYSETKRMLLNYIRSYMIIISITFVFTLIGFMAFGVKYALVLSIISGIFDLLPILGITMIYLPIAFIFFLNGNIFSCIGIIGLYLFVSLVRQFVEPRIVSSSLGLHPVAVLAAIFIGLKANGVSGMFFCIFLVVFYNIFKKVEVL